MGPTPICLVSLQEEGDLDRDTGRVHVMAEVETGVARPQDRQRQGLPATTGN